MSRSLPNVAQIIKIEDFMSASITELQGKSFRLTGYVISHDLVRCRAVIVDRCSAAKLQVNTSLIEPFGAQMNHLYQFVGDTELCEDTDSTVADRCLKAISYRSADGLDLVKYYSAVDARCAYLQQRNITTV